MKTRTSRLIAMTAVVILTAGLLRAQSMGGIGGVIGGVIADAIREQQRDQRNLAWMYANGFWLNGIVAAEEAYFAALYNDDYLRTFETRVTDVLEEFPTQAATYQLANQAPYTVAMGPVQFRFQGAIVRSAEGVAWTPVNNRLRFHRFNTLHAFSGWATDVVQDPLTAAISEDGGTRGYVTAYLKGYLTRRAFLTHVGQTGPGTSCAARIPSRYVYRYQYHAPDGTVTAFFERPAEAARAATWTTAADGTCTVNASEPTFYWSADGNASLDTSNKCKPVIRWADGTTEEFRGAHTRTNDSNVPSEIAWSFFPQCSPEEFTADIRRIDRNGNITTYRSTATTETMIDPLGRQTVLTFDTNVGPFPRLRFVDLPSIGTAPPLRYTINWGTPLEVRFDLIWPDYECHSLVDGAVQPCSHLFDETLAPSIVELVESVTTSDGRQYRFEYGPWGNLTRVTEPAGAVREFVYGDASNLTYGAAAVSLFNRPELGVNPAGAIFSISAGDKSKMQARGMIRERVLPDGLGGVAHETSTQFVSRQPCDITVTGCRQVWKEVTRPDGAVVKTGLVVHNVPSKKANDQTLSIPPNFPTDRHGWVIGEEVWSGTSMLAASYVGDKDTGELWYDFDSVKWVATPFALASNPRPRKMRVILDGLSTTTNLVYGHTIDIDPDPTRVELRDLGLASSSCLFAGAVAADGCSPAGATPLSRTDATYLHYFPGTFGGRNLLGLRTAERLFGPDSTGTAFAATPIAEETYGYDEFPVTASNLPATVLDTSLGLGAGAPRGNLTSTRLRVDAAKTVTATSTYYDTGVVASMTNPKGRTITFTPTFALCSSAPILTSTITEPDGHQTSTRVDCMSGSTLRETDPNGQSSFTQYDHLGRVVEIADPGDVLTALPQSGSQPFTRDPNAPTGAGSTVGQARVTSWKEYLGLGTAQEREVVYVRDGSPGGLYTKTFGDGLGRPVQVRTKVDPATTGGFAELVSTTVYDGMGRSPTTFAPCFATASNVRTANCRKLTSTTTYDALGRELSVTAAGNRTVTTTYGQEGGRWLQTTVNPRGFTSRTNKNLLGQTVQIDDESPRCSGFCTTRYEYDVAGRLLEITDPLGNKVEQEYDGLGRRTRMSDPDMGTWSYEYDDNDNLIRQADAKGQVILFRYDDLDRLIVKDLPPSATSPTDIGPEDVTYFYDGTGPAPPADTNPVPMLGTISPTTIQAGSGAFTLTVDGTNFVSGSVVRVNGANRTTTFESSIRLTAQILHSDVASAGSLTITVFNPAPAGGLSGSVQLVVSTANNPVPVLTGLSPLVVLAGSGAVTLTVTGSNFVSGSVVRFDGSNRPTTFLSATKLTAQISATDVQTAGLHLITVFNPAPGGGTSDSMDFWVEHPIPVLSTISPTSVQAGSAGFTLTVNGSNFVSGSVVRFNGNNRTTTFVNSGQLTAQIPSSDVASGDTFPITVFSPAPGGGTSSAATLTVSAPNNPVPSLTSISPPVVLAGGGGFPLTATGSNFVSGAVVRINGSDRATTFNSATSLTAQLTAADVQTPGTRTITVFNPAPGGGVSGGQTLVVNGPPAVTLTSPTNGQLFSTVPATVPLRANVVDDTAGAQVSYFNGTTLIGSSTTAPAYAFDWPNVQPGQYSIKARVTDAHGATAESATAIITVAAVTIPFLVAEWKFEEIGGTTTADSSGNGNTGTLRNDPEWGEGRTGNGLQFISANASTVSITPSAALQAMSNNFTISFCALPAETHEIDVASTDGVAGQTGQKYAFAPRLEAGSDAGIGVSVGRNGVSVYEHAANHMPAVLVYPAPETAPLAGWTHIAVVYENKQPTLYVNGVLVRVGLTSLKTNVRAVPADIGGRVGGYYSGTLDDVRIHGVALSAATIQSLAKGVVSHWKLDDASGTTGADASGNGNTLLLQTGAGWGSGKIGGALTLDGTQGHARVANSANFRMTFTLTASAWVFATSTANGTLLAKEGDYVFAIRGRTLQWGFNNGSPGWIFIDTGYVVPLNQWVHITVVYGGGNARTYANGAPVHVEGVEGRVLPPAFDDFRVGGRQAIAENFAGRLDDLRIYDHALEPQDVQALDETVWVEDSYPAGAAPGELTDWINGNTPPGPYSGALAIQSTNVVGLHQNSFSGATSTLTVAADEVLMAHVYLDPTSPPQMIALQWNDGTWEHRAYWGANLLPWGTDGTDSRRFMGPLPPAGQWVRLEVPASLVGLAGRTLNGMAFTLHDGRAIWDHAGKTSAPQSQATFNGPTLVTGKILGTPRNDFHGEVGMKITVGSTALTVRSLGRLYAGGNTGTHRLKIVRASDGAELASVRLLMLGGALNQFKYADLVTPVTLAANTSYYVVSEETFTGDTWYHDDTILTTTARATVNGSVSRTAPDDEAGIPPGPWTFVAAPGHAFVPLDLKYVP